MIRADKRVMRAMLTNEGRVIMDFITKCREEKDIECRQADGNNIYRAQGAALELSELEALAISARDH